MNTSNAKKMLIEDRRKYIDKIVNTVEYLLEHNSEELAADCIIEGAKGLISVNGTIQYLEQAGENTYPRFNTFWEG